jgi:hypothetical protein
LKRTTKITFKFDIFLKTNFILLKVVNYFDTNSLDSESVRALSPQQPKQRTKMINNRFKSPSFSSVSARKESNYKNKNILLKNNNNKLNKSMSSFNYKPTQESLYSCGTNSCKCCLSCRQKFKLEEQMLNRPTVVPPQPKLNRPQMRRFNHRNNNRFKQTNNNNSVNWNELGNKIEDWFEYAPTPEQKTVYRFLKEIKNDDDDDRQSISSSIATNSDDIDRKKTESLEQILDNLKR